mmetsp:Transcript_22629/g.47018  ORF Transcript_22629/g.47018 Transcript_22629/m.47018 type:complete len:369 (-) Transcript_22629:2234-3340(-)
MSNSIKSQNDDATQHLTGDNGSICIPIGQARDSSTRSTHASAILNVNADDDTKPRRRNCSVAGCKNGVVQGGVCVTHGAKRRLCRFPGCTKHSKNAGLCSKHGPPRKRCEHEGCSNVAVRGGMCKSHGAWSKICSYQNCKKIAINGGICHQHHTSNQTDKNEELDQVPQAQDKVEAQGTLTPAMATASAMQPMPSLAPMPPIVTGLLPGLGGTDSYAPLPIPFGLQLRGGNGNPASIAAAQGLYNSQLFYYQSNLPPFNMNNPGLSLDANFALNPPLNHCHQFQQPGVLNNPSSFRFSRQMPPHNYDGLNVASVGQNPSLNPYANTNAGFNQPPLELTSTNYVATMPGLGQTKSFHFGTKSGTEKGDS